MATKENDLDEKAAVFGRFVQAFMTSGLGNPDWHWMTYHTQRFPHPVTDGLFRALTEIECKVPKYGFELLDRLFQIKGKEGDQEHYQQIISLFSEILVIAKFVEFDDWPKDYKFAPEPSTIQSNKNPEIIMFSDSLQVGLEVKAPSLSSHAIERSKNDMQLPGRIFQKNEVDNLAGGRGVTLPRDNPVKDFLISAEEKFRPFKDEHENFIGILAIVWDDYIQEPLTSLIEPQCGLLTENSFFKDESEKPVLFPSIDGVVVVRNQVYLANALGLEFDIPFVADGLKGPFDWGRKGVFPFKVGIDNSVSGNKIPTEVIDCFDLRFSSPELGAEYSPSDVIMWI